MLQSPLERVLGRTLTLRPTWLIYSMLTIFEGLLIASPVHPGKAEIVVGGSGHCWWNCLSGKGKAAEVEWASAFREVSTTFSSLECKSFWFNNSFFWSPSGMPGCRIQGNEEEEWISVHFSALHYWGGWWRAQIGSPSGSYLQQRT